MKEKQLERKKKRNKHKIEISYVFLYNGAVIKERSGQV